MFEDNFWGVVALVVIMVCISPVAIPLLLGAGLFCLAVNAAGNIY